MRVSSCLPECEAVIAFLYIVSYASNRVDVCFCVVPAPGFNVDNRMQTVKIDFNIARVVL
jgi:hypothetical protein